MSFIDENGVRQPTQGEWGLTGQGFIADYKPFTMVDGEGVRNALYVSGCLFQCPGCWNKSIQGFRNGEPFTSEMFQRIFRDLEPDYVAGLSFLGGEPFLNTGTLLPVARRMREVYGDTKTLWTWTGYTIEQLLEETGEKKELLMLTDVLVDGSFVERLKDSRLAYRGSSNQRIITVKNALSSGVKKYSEDKPLVSL